MFSKYSLDPQNIAMLREHLENIPGILRAGWFQTSKAVPHLA